MVSMTILTIPGVVHLNLDNVPTKKMGQLSVTMPLLSLVDTVVVMVQFAGTDVTYHVRQETNVFGRVQSVRDNQCVRMDLMWICVFLMMTSVLLCLGSPNVQLTYHIMENAMVQLLEQQIIKNMTALLEETNLGKVLSKLLTTTQ